jgi:hypothetical protein
LATYQIEPTSATVRFVRQGEVEVVFLNHPGRLSLGEIAFKTFVRRKFTALFQEEFSGDGLQLGDGLRTRGKMNITQLEATNGWLALGWSLPAEDQVAGAFDDPQPGAPAKWGAGSSVNYEPVVYKNGAYETAAGAAELQWRISTCPNGAPWQGPTQRPIQKPAEFITNGRASDDGQTKP